MLLLLLDGGVSYQFVLVLQCPRAVTAVGWRSSLTVCPCLAVSKCCCCRWVEKLSNNLSLFSHVHVLLLLLGGGVLYRFDLIVSSVHVHAAAAVQMRSL